MTEHEKLFTKRERLADVQARFEQAAKPIPEKHQVDLGFRLVGKSNEDLKDWLLYGVPGGSFTASDNDGTNTIGIFFHQEKWRIGIVAHLRSKHVNPRYRTNPHMVAYITCQDFEAAEEMMMTLGQAAFGNNDPLLLDDADEGFVME